MSYFRGTKGLFTPILSFYAFTVLSFTFLDVQRCYGANSLPDPVPRQFLTSQQYAFLEGMLNTHIKYFLSSDVITSSGFPLGAYREGYRADFNYSNPTEWGYTIQAWIVAADRGLITSQDAAARIETALNTMIALQNDPAQNYQYLFYPYYIVAADPAGIDLDMPYHDSNSEIPSIDNGLLYTSLLITQGWANVKGLSALEAKSKAISEKMKFRLFLNPQKSYLAHSVHALTARIGPSAWDIYSDEGGEMAWIAYVSGSITLDEYKVLIDNLKRSPRQWNGILVKEAAWFNAMFTWGIRSLSGFPVANWEAGIPNQYSAESFSKTVSAHLAYGNSLGVHYSAFSDAMTQNAASCTKHYFPPNLSNNVPVIAPDHATPHALFIPLNIGPDLAPTDLNTLINQITDLKNDSTGYYHDGADGHKPFGFEVTTSFYRNSPYWPPTARHIYETLSAAYTVLSIQQGLNIHDGKMTFLHYAAKNPEYIAKVQEVLGYLYSAPNRVLRVPADYSTIQAAIDDSENGDTVLIAAGTYDLSQSLAFNKSGVALLGAGTAVLNGPTGSPVIICSNLSGVRKARITEFRIEGGSAAIQCAGTVSALQIDNNVFSGHGIILDDGASVVIRNSTFNDCAPIIGSGHNNIQIIGNNIKNTIGPLPPGISLGAGSTGLIQDNSFYQRWNGAINLYDGSVVQIIRNLFMDCQSWDAGSGVNVYGSTATFWNNLFLRGRSNHAPGGVVNASSSTLAVYNNVFADNSSSNNAKGIAIYGVSSGLTVKNNIFIGNNSGQDTIDVSGTSAQDFSYNDFWNNTTARLTSEDVILGPGNLYIDPSFIVDPPGIPSYWFSHGSPVEDAGDPAGQFNDLNATRNDMGIHGGPYGDSQDMVLNMVEMPWRQTVAPHNSTGAAVCQMILDYINEGPGMPLVSQNAIYEYAKSPNASGTELNANEVAKVLGHFDPYDALVTGWADSCDGLPGGNPHQGYNYSVDSYTPGTDAIDKYMRDICHWMAYTVSQEEWSKTTSALVARPQSPAAVPLDGTYSHWVAVKGFAVSANPCPDPRTNPWSTPGFAIHGFWIKDPLVSGLGQDTYKTAAECGSTYFKALSAPGDPYHGKYVLVAEPPAHESNAEVQIQGPRHDQANLEFIQAFKAEARTPLRKQSWRDLVDVNLLSDAEAVAAFDGSHMGSRVLVHRPDVQGEDYYLVPFMKKAGPNGYLTNGVIVLNAQNGAFKEASWTQAPEEFLKVDKERAFNSVLSFILCVRAKSGNSVPPARQQHAEQKDGLTPEHRDLSGYLDGATAELIWEPRSPYSSSLYQPYWRIVAQGDLWYVTQDAKVFSQLSPKF